MKPVSFTVGKRIDYYGGFTNEFYVNGNLGFCINPHLPNPVTGTYGEIHEDMSWGASTGTDGGTAWHYMRPILYYGLDGPGYRRYFFPDAWYDGTPMNRERMIVCEHVMLSDVYAYDLLAACGECPRDFRIWIIKNVTGYGGGTVGLDEWYPNSMRGKLDNRNGNGLDWSVPDTFKTYIMAGGVNAFGTRQQNIAFFESNGTATLRKSASHNNWL